MYVCAGEGCNTTLYNNHHPRIWECSFSFCAKVLNASVVNGNYSESLISEVSLNETRHFGPNAFGWSAGRFQSFSTSSLPNQRYKSILNRTFSINLANKLDLGRELQRTLSTTSSDIVGEALNRQDIHQLADRLATSMTNHIRQGPNNTNVPGQAFLTEPYIIVRWYWGMYLAALLAMGLGLFLGTVLTSSKRGMQLWKGSSTALLFARLRGFGDMDWHLGNPKMLDAMAQEVEGRLDPEAPNRLSFVKTAGEVKA